MNRPTSTSSVRRATGVALVLATLLALVGCGDDDGTGASDATSVPETTVASSSGSTEAPDDIDPNGVLRIGMPGQEMTRWADFDLTTAQSIAVATHRHLYDNLLRQRPDGTLEPGLAKSATAVDPSTIKIELQPDVRFTDGTPFDAEAVKFGIERNIESQHGASFAVELLQDVESVTVDSPLELTIKLKKPIAGFWLLFLARGETMIVSPTAVRNGVDISTNPVGAGPFMLDEVRPDQMVRMVKNPDYFQADKIRLAAVEFINMGPDVQTAVNALRSGTIDVMDFLQATPETIASLESGNIKTRYEKSEAVTLWGQAWKDRPPFDDLRVRQALNYGLDREAIGERLFAGKSEPQWGFVTEDSKFFNPDLKDYYARDVDKAKQLLAEAGVPNLEFDVYYTPGLSQRFAEVVQQQWADIGVTINLLTTQNSVQDFFLDARAPLYLFPLYNPGLQKVMRTLRPGTLGDVGNWNDPEMNALIDEIQSHPPDSDDAIEPWHRLQQIAFEKAVNIFGVFGAHASAWNDERIGNLTRYIAHDGMPRIDAFDAYIKR